MAIDTVRRIVFAFFILYLGSVVWPVVALVGNSQTLILGFPLAFAWAIGWIILGGIALGLLEWAESRHEVGLTGAEG